MFNKIMNPCPQVFEQELCPFYFIHPFNPFSVTINDLPKWTSIQSLLHLRTHSPAFCQVEYPTQFNLKDSGCYAAVKVLTLTLIVSSSNFLAMLSKPFFLFLTLSPMVTGVGDTELLWLWPHVWPRPPRWHRGSGNCERGKYEEDRFQIPDHRQAVWI